MTDNITVRAATRDRERERQLYNGKSDAGCKGNRQTGNHFHLSNISNTCSTSYYNIIDVHNERH